MGRTPGVERVVKPGWIIGARAGQGKTNWLQVTGFAMTWVNAKIGWRGGVVRAFTGSGRCGGMVGFYGGDGRKNGDRGNAPAGQIGPTAGHAVEQETIWRVLALDSRTHAADVCCNRFAALELFVVLLFPGRSWPALRVAYQLQAHGFGLPARMTTLAPLAARSIAWR